MDPELPQVILFSILLLAILAVLVWTVPRFAKSVTQVFTLTSRQEKLLSQAEADQNRASALLDRQEALMLRVEQSLERLERNFPRGS